ncbi:MAG: PmoA family protein [Clostridia bacterium]|nr:PmoA family protein [Clostridia bacterium]
MTITVSAGPHVRKNAICAVALTEPTLPAGNYLLVPEKGAKIPASVQACGEAAELCFVLDYLGANETMTFAVEAANTAPRMTAEVTDRGVTIADNGAFVTEYYTGTDIAKPYMGPFTDRYGADITRLDFEIKEHPHHRSLWVSHGDVNGVDTWNEPKDRHGYIRNREITDLFSGSTFAAFTAKNQWTSHGGDPLLDETTSYKLYATDAATTVVDITITLTAAYGDVTLGPTKEAGPLAVRMAEPLKVDNTGTMKNGVGGINEDEIWMKKAPWVDYYGVTEGRVCGVAMFDNPENDQFPTYWHARDYGLMAVNNFYRGGAKQIAAGEAMTFAYRVVFHNGDTETAAIGAMYADYATPAEIAVEA